MDVLTIIRKFRQKKGFTQDDIAKKLGIARTTYQAIESGVNNLKIDDFFAIIKILEIPLSTFSNEDLIVISRDDLTKLKDAAATINDITEKLSAGISITIGDNSPSNINIGSNKENQNKNTDE